MKFTLIIIWSCLLSIEKFREQTMQHVNICALRERRCTSRSSVIHFFSTGVAHLGEGATLMQAKWIKLDVVDIIIDLDVKSQSRGLTL